MWLLTLSGPSKTMGKSVNVIQLYFFSPHLTFADFRISNSNISKLKTQNMFRQAACHQSGAKDRNKQSKECGFIDKH